MREDGGCRMTWEAGKSRRNELYEVWVDGERDALAIRADIHGGWVESYATDTTGTIQRDGTGRARVVRREGRIEIRKVNPGAEGGDG